MLRVESHSGDTTLCDKICQWLVTGLWFSPDTLVSSTNKTERHDIIEILLKVVLNSINPTLDTSDNVCHALHDCRYSNIWFYFCNQIYKPIFIYYCSYFIGVSSLSFSNYIYIFFLCFFYIFVCACLHFYICSNLCWFTVMFSSSISYFHVFMWLNG